MVEVIKAGLFTTVQDEGRLGYSALGVPVSGVMDNYAAQLANAIVGNTNVEALLEITLTGPTLLFKTASVISICGADLSPTLNGKAIKNNHATSIEKHDKLSFGALKNGSRAYIAVSGGFQTEVIMKSRSMYTHVTSKSSIMAGDVLKILPKPSNFKDTYASVKYNDALLFETGLHVFKGPEFDLLTNFEQKKIVEESFTISKNNNRMGYQIEETLTHNLPTILTAPVLPGTVQLTPAGRLIILMKDGQTTGGYPRVLQLNDEAIHVLAQKKVGDSIQFILI